MGDDGRTFVTLPNVGEFPAKITFGPGGIPKSVTTVTPNGNTLVLAVIREQLQQAGQQIKQGPKIKPRKGEENRATSQAGGAPPQQSEAELLVELSEQINAFPPATFTPEKVREFVQSISGDASIPINVRKKLVALIRSKLRRQGGGV